jgi:iron(III) transport system substrate-binding protein
MKRYVALMLCLLCALPLVMAQGKAGSGKLVLYSTVYDDEYNMIVDAFTSKYNIKIDLVQGGAGELKSRIKAEAANPQGDVMFGGLLYSDFLSMGNLLETYVAANDAAFPKGFRNTTGKLTWTTTQVVNLLVNRKLAAKLGVQIKGYKDLLNPALKGKIISADPAASSSAWRQLTTMLVVMGNGDYQSPAAWDYMDKLVQNLGGVITTSSSAVYKGVFNGEYVVGLTYEAPCVTYIKEGKGDIVEVVYPVEGTTNSPFASAIIKDAKNMANAKLFIDFLASDEAQKLWAGSEARHANTNIPTTNKYLTPLSKMKTVPEDLEYIAVHQKEILERFAKIWAKNN